MRSNVFPHYHCSCQLVFDMGTQAQHHIFRVEPKKFGGKGKKSRIQKRTPHIMTMVHPDGTYDEVHF